ncbi:DUF695 domain-containing protein [Erysipelothrix rhusiopathiae]|nr:DUF695 domain-containing protein [Erysipelothrix rhusiopathiae]
MYESNFQFYPLIMDEKPHSVRVDLNALVFEEGYPHLYVVRKPYKGRDNGFPTELAFDALNTFEVAITDLLSPMDVQFIGAITGNDVCDYFFVSKDCIALESILKEHFPEEVIGVIVREHDDFEIYKSVLYPNEFQIAIIYNQNLCLNLENEGERFKVERDVEVLTVFERLEDAQQFGQHFEQFADSFTLEPREDGMIQTRMIASIVPTLPTMNGISQHIVTLTNQYNGYYEGWKCSVHK